MALGRRDGGGADSGNRGPGPSGGSAAPSGLTRANAARMYDYYLGGSANFAIDRDTARKALEVVPEIGCYARANRSFLRRAVTYLSSRGIDQFLDLGSGIPTVGNVHEVAHRHDPTARVAYVDVEHVSVLHARQFLADTDAVTVTHADLREVGEVLAAPGVADFLDLARPVAVVASSILTFLDDGDDPAGVVAAYRDACAPGSYLVLSHPSPVTVTAEQVAAGEAIYRGTATPARVRGRDRIATFLPGYELVDPGLVLLGHWRPDDGEDDSAEWTNGYAAVGYLPDRLSG